MASAESEVDVSDSNSDSGSDGVWRRAEGGAGRMDGS